jgi:hypothetical protein
MSDATSEFYTVEFGTKFVLASDYDALAAECEALRADAERYRYVITKADWEIWNLGDGKYHDCGFTDKPTLDAAIDKARQEGGE